MKNNERLSRFSKHLRSIFYKSAVKNLFPPPPAILSLINRNAFAPRSKNYTSIFFNPFYLPLNKNREKSIKPCLSH